MSNPGFNFNRDKHYSLAPHNSGLAVTARGGLLQQHPWTAANDQRWRFQRLGGTEFFRIISVASGQVVDIEAGSSANNARLIVAPRRDEALSQLWRILYLGGSRFRLESYFGGRGWDGTSSGGVEGTGIILFNWLGGDSQQFRFNEVLDLDSMAGYGSRITLFSRTNFAGEGLSLPLGSHNLTSLGFNDLPMSIRVPRGVRVTLFEHVNAAGRSAQYTGDASTLGDLNGQVSSVLVELVALCYEHQDYRGRSIALGVGNYRYHDLQNLGLTNDTLSSVHVPAGLQVVLFEHEGFLGDRRMLTSDTPALESFDDMTSSIQVKAVGAVIPASALRYGDQIVLRSWHNRNLTASPDQLARNETTTTDATARFRVYRAGGTTTRDYVCYGDVIALRRDEGLFLSARPDESVVLNGPRVDTFEQFAVVRHGGATQSDTFVSKGDRFALFNTLHKNFLSGEEDRRVLARRTTAGWWETWTLQTIFRGGSEVRALDPFEVPDADYFALREKRGPAIAAQDLAGLRAANASVLEAFSTCGAQACPADLCGVQSCGARRSGVRRRRLRGQRLRGRRLRRRHVPGGRLRGRGVRRQRLRDREHPLRRRRLRRQRLLHQPLPRRRLRGRRLLHRSHPHRPVHLTVGGAHRDPCQRSRWSRTARASRSASCSRRLSRLSWLFFPRASAISTLAKPCLKYTRVATAVIPSRATESPITSISRRWRSSLRAPSGRWPKAAPVISMMRAPIRYASPREIVQNAWVRSALPARSIFTSLPLRTIPASNRAPRS